MASHRDQTFLVLLHLSGPNQIVFDGDSAFVVVRCGHLRTFCDLCRVVGDCGDLPGGIEGHFLGDGIENPFRSFDLALTCEEL